MTQITQSWLKSVLSYDAKTGVFTWIAKPSNYFPTQLLGTTAGGVNKGGRIHIRLLGRLHQAHRLAWLYVYGELPKEDIDHINRIPTDNRIDNLRLVSHAQNCQNRYSRFDSQSALQGVDFQKRDSLWRARISASGKTVYLGMFKTKEEAYAAYQKAAAEIHTHNPHALKVAA
jgi:HNH endonuclease/AP2 domain